MMIRYVYGPHWNRLDGSYAIIVDTVGFPKKCVYDCIYCSIGPTNTKAIQPVSLIPPDDIIADLKWLLSRVDKDFNTILFYGTGDPWLNPWFPLIVEKTRDIVRELGLDVELHAVTTGHLLSKQWAIQALKSIDRIYIKIDGLGEDYSLINNPHPEAKMKNLIVTIKNIREIMGSDRIFYEVTLLEYEGFSNANMGSLDQISAFLSMVKAENVVIRTVHRLPRVAGVKPVSKKKYEKARGFLENKGFKVHLEHNIMKPYGGSIDFDEVMLYNHLLRKPLTIKEIMMSYKLSVGAVAGFLNSLERKGLVAKIPWRTQVYYKGVWKK